jgi:Tol biopolymer transport system component
VLVEGVRSHVPTSFTPDGRELIYDAFNMDATARDIWILSVEGSRQPRVLVGGPFVKNEGILSPDGRWLAYASNESGQASVFVRPFPDGEGRWQISTGQGVEPRWSRDGRELFYRSDTILYRVTIDTSRGFSASRPERLVDRVASGTGIPTYSPSPDGSRFLTFRSAEGGGSLRTLHLDTGFAARLSEIAAPR